MGNTAPYVRKATYAGRLYPNDPDALSSELQSHISNAFLMRQKQDPVEAPKDESMGCAHDHAVRALLVPQSFEDAAAAFTAAYAYKYLNPVSLASISTIVLLHPHHYSAKDKTTRKFAAGKCLFSNATELATPLGNLRVAKALRTHLLELNPERFQRMTREIDEQETSGEVQFPWLAHCLNLAFRRDEVEVLPILVGDLKTKDEIDVGNLLRPILNRKNVLTIVTTEFCRWGHGYQPWDPSVGAPHEFISKLDWHAIRLIQDLNAGAFAAYLLQTDNPISGRHGVSVWMRAVMGNTSSLKVDCTKYLQSVPCQTLDDTSVSYAAMVATEREKESISK